MRTVAEHMTANPHTIGADQHVVTALQVMRGFGVRHLPVLDDGRLVGFLSDRELPWVGGALDPRLRVSELMNPGPYSASPHTSLAVVARDMADHKIEVVIVLEAGRVVGILTVVDVARALAEVLRTEDVAHCVEPCDRFGHGVMVAR